MTLLWRVFGTNAVILVMATLVLVVSPLTVSFPIALAELVAVTGGLAAMLVLNLILLRRVLRPLARLTSLMRGIDPLRPGERARVDAADPEVAELTAAFNEMLGRLERERRDSARRALAAQESERRRIARELHDGVGQVLTAAVLQLDRAGREARPPASAGVSEARETVRASLEEVRGIAQRLRPEALDDLGLASALAALTNDVSRRTGVHVERTIAAGVPLLDPEEELVIYRVAQEALTNVVRHAGAPSARLALEVRGGRVELEISDAGAGFESAGAFAGTGVLGMRERALLIGADLELASAPGKGTAVRLRLARRT
jgi:two-component system sensor histidine kinase UhpB